MLFWPTLYNSKAITEVIRPYKAITLRVPGGIWLVVELRWDYANKHYHKVRWVEWWTKYLQLKTKKASRPIYQRSTLVHLEGTDWLSNLIGWKSFHLESGQPVDAACCMLWPATEMSVHIIYPVFQWTYNKKKMYYNKHLDNIIIAVYRHINQSNVLSCELQRDIHTHSRRDTDFPKLI